VRAPPAVSALRVPGLDVRRRAAARLEAFLRGVPFEPLTEEEIADPRDRALANKLATTAIRRHGQLSRLVGEMLAKSVPPDAGLFEAALRIGMTQLLFLGELGDHSAIHLAVETVKSDDKARPFAGLTNGVLRNVQRRRGELLMPDSALIPDWLSARWREAYGNMALLGMIGALLDGPVLDLTAGPGGGETIKGFGGTPVIGDTWRVKRPGGPVAELPGYAEGRWWVQDAAAAIPARLLRVEPLHAVADLCAAPGGKTAQLAAAGGTVTAVDNDPIRLARLAGNMARLGLSETVTVAVGDAATFGEAGLYDRVLLDAPCTGTGIFRRHPEVVWQRNPADIADRVKLQKGLLGNAARITAKGGVLVYCVCSLEPEEAEAQAAAFLSGHPGFVPVPVEAGELDGWAAPVSGAGNLRTVPGMRVPGPAGGTLDGFFAARFLRMR